jgi:hypothetical protein
LNSKERARQLRPFYFVVVVWGEQYRDYFLEYCLPSMLAPGNIPALAGCRSAKYLIATTSEDWLEIKKTAIFRELARHAEPVFLELPPESQAQPYWRRNIIGQKLCCDVVFKDRAYRIFNTPDAIYSDGMVTRMHELASAGIQVIFKLPAPTSDTDLFFNTLAQMNMLPSSSARDSGIPLAYSARQIVSAALASAHTMFLANEWEASYFCGYAATPWWRVPKEDGMVVGGLYWDALLIDYAAVGEHNSSLLDDRGSDGDYVMRTVGNLETIYVVRDSDEFHDVSWASNPPHDLHRQFYPEFAKGASFRASWHSPMFNALHRQLLFLPTRVHAGSINEKWKQIEEKALRTLVTWVDPPSDLSRLGRGLPDIWPSYRQWETRIASVRLPWWRRNSVTWSFCRICLIPLVISLAYFRISRLKLTWPWIKICALLLGGKIIFHRIKLAVNGDRIAVCWWRWRLRKLGADILQQPFDEPRPETPK